MSTVIVSCKMNDTDPRALMSDVLTRLQDITVFRLLELLPWNWKAEQVAFKAARDGALAGCLAWINIDGAFPYPGGQHAQGQAGIHAVTQGNQQAYCHLIEQDRSAWNSEVAVGPCVEMF